MKRKLLAIILALAMMLALVGCTEEVRPPNISKGEGSIFVIVENGDYVDVYVHKETRVMYAYSPYSGGFVVMIDADGKPLLWEGEL